MKRPISISGRLAAMLLAGAVAPTMASSPPPPRMDLAFSGNTVTLMETRVGRPLPSVTLDIETGGLVQAPHQPINTASPCLNPDLIEGKRVCPFPEGVLTLKYDVQESGSILEWRSASTSWRALRRRGLSSSAPIWSHSGKLFLGELANNEATLECLDHRQGLSRWMYVSSDSSREEQDMRYRAPDYLRRFGGVGTVLLTGDPLTAWSLPYPGKLITELRSGN